MTTRYCAKCEQHHPVGEFYLRRNRRGELVPGGYCKNCTRMCSKQSYLRTDREVLREQRRRSAATPQGKARSVAWMAKWREANREEARRKARESAARRRASVAGTLKNRVTAGMNAALARAGAARKERMNWEEIVGYTVADLRAHLEERFLPGMSWDNRREWHIDHKLPLASFTFTGPTDPEFRRAWSLDNLQPLWREQNQQKHAKLHWQPKGAQA